MSTAPKYITPAHTPVWKKDKRVTLQRFVVSGQTGRGQPAGTWQDIEGEATVWASVEPLNVRTTEYAHQLYAQATHRVFVDYRSDVTRDMRLMYAGRAMYIGHAINLREANVTLELLCTEGDP